jgi:hypothetical protein
MPLWWFGGLVVLNSLVNNDKYVTIQGMRDCRISNPQPSLPTLNSAPGKYS